jgi:hypothetical protein
MPLAAWDLSVFNYAGRDAAPPPPIDDAPGSELASPSAPVVGEVPPSEPGVILPDLGELIRAALEPPPTSPVDAEAFQVGMDAAAANAPAPPDAPPPIDFAALLAQAPAAVPQGFADALIAELGPLPPPDAELFHAAMMMAANDAPVPPAPAVPPAAAGPEISFPTIDPYVFVNALREARQ